MNPLTNTKNITKLSEQELRANFKSSWHDQYKDSAWLFIGGLPYDLTEGDVIAIFSQYGEIVNINLVRDKDSGKSKGFGFLCYEDQRSTALAVDNFNGIKILGRTVRVDHVTDYKMPKVGKKTDEVTKQLHQEGCAPIAQPPPTKEFRPFVPEPLDLRETLVDQIKSEIKLPMRLPIYTHIKDEATTVVTETETVADLADVEEKSDKKVKKEKKNKKKKSKKKKKKRSNSEESDSSENDEEDKHAKKKKKKSHKKKQSDSEDSSTSHEDKSGKEKSYKRKKDDKDNNDSERKKRK